MTDINSNFVNDINAKLTDLSEKNQQIHLQIWQVLLRIVAMSILTSIILLDHNAVKNSQYSRREIIELNKLVPAEIHEDVLEESVYKDSSLTRVEDLHACDQMKRSGRVIIKCKGRKQKESVMNKHKILDTKSQELLNLKFSWRIFLSKSMSDENHQFTCKCRKLKSARKIHSTLFFNNVVNVKLMECGRLHKIFPVTDIGNLMETDNLTDYINKAFS